MFNKLKIREKVYVSNVDLLLSQKAPNCTGGNWPLAQNLWRFESTALTIVLDAAEVKAGQVSAAGP